MCGNRTHQRQLKLPLTGFEVRARHQTNLTPSEKYYTIQKNIHCLQENNTIMKTCYLNNAATTWPKPECVSEAMSNFLLKGGANSSRGSSSERDMNTMNLILDCRIKLAEFFGGYDNANPLLVTFTANITESINIILRGYLKAGMNALTTSMEHNAVMRPLRALERQGVGVKVLACDSEGRLNPDDLMRELSDSKYDLVIMSHASNVCGTVQPIEKIADICAKFGVPLVADTAQTAGAQALNASSGLGLSALCFTGHKGLFGPQGIGGIVWKPDFAARVEPLITGGTGSYSHLEFQPEDMPDKFEAGTPNLPGIAGLNAALDWLKDTGIKNIAEREKILGSRLLEGLMSRKKIALAGRLSMNGRMPVFAFNAEGIDNGTLADRLSLAGFETRPGLHCAPSAHKTLGTLPEGALRVSPGYFNTEDDIDDFLAQLDILL